MDQEIVLVVDAVALAAAPVAAVGTLGGSCTLYHGCLSAGCSSTLVM